MKGMVPNRFLATRLRKILIRFRKGPAATERGRADRLAKTITDLQSLNGNTEREFLAIGGKLTEFVGGARRLSTDMAALEQIFQEQDRQASEVLGRVLERSREMEARAATGDQALSAVRDSARQIGRTFRGFQDTVASFQVLGSLTRIETARLGASGTEFGYLAAEVATLTQSIEASGQRIQEASSALHRQMQDALTQVTGLRASVLDQLPRLIADVTGGMRSVEERHRRAIDVFLRQAAEYKEVSGAFEDLISAVQFHDITRQQIEHVVEALARLRAEGSAEPRPVLALQASQLLHAEQVFGSSVGRIEHDLEGIAARVREMAGTSQKLLGTSANEQASSVQQLESRLKAILQALATCEQGETETQGVVTRLGETVARMRDSVAEMREIEIRIRRIALNATIRAVQIGDAGNALNVLADVMLRLAADSAKLTDAVAESLDGIAGAASRLSDGRTAGDGAESATRSILSGMTTAISELHASSEAGIVRLNQITAIGARLGDQIQGARASFSAGAMFTETILGARSSLEKMCAQYTPSGADLTVHELDDFAARYTMQAERDVHASVTAGNGSLAPEGQPPDRDQPEQETSEFGANVELF